MTLEAPEALLPEFANEGELRIVSLVGGGGDENGDEVDGALFPEAGGGVLAAAAAGRCFWLLLP